MQLRLHGELAELIGPSFAIDASTVADAIEGLSRQVANWPRQMLIDVIGFPTEEALTSLTETEAVDLIPAMRGGGGKFGSVILGAALIAISFVPGIGAAVSTALLVNGALMVASGVFSLFMKAPTASKAGDPPASKYLGLNRNTTEIGTPITNAWGRVQLSGQYLSIQSDADKLVYGIFPENPS